MNKTLIPFHGIEISFIKNIKTNGIFGDLYEVSSEEVYRKMEQHMIKIEEGTMKIFSLQEIEEFIKLATKECVNALKKLE